jgi:hypothetical protein
MYGELHFSTSPASALCVAGLAVKAFHTLHRVEIISDGVIYRAKDNRVLQIGTRLEF